ncbi:MAG TPA: 50S ribosomal protein L2, partial [Planctomycetota bacterium]|nr:50S ribosomal protein L2 [Planctomycetota bacterium]
MGIKVYNPTSAGRRNSSVNDFAEVTAAKPERSLLQRIRRTGGRNAQGRITSRFRGGGARKLYRVVDFRRQMDGVPATVKAIEYDPNRTANIALLYYANGHKAYILAPKGLEVGAVVTNGKGSEPRVGNCMELKDIPLGLEVHAIELQPGRGAQLARSAGAVCQLMALEGDYATVVLRSGEMRRIPASCRATIGQVGNLDHQNVRWGKAGRLRHKGRRPHNRGTAMNPVAHPMGGGEGRTGGGRHPCSPTGKLAKGGKTRKPRQASDKLIIRRRKKARG